MQRVLRTVVFLVGLIVWSVARVSAGTTADQLVGLARAGLSDDILIALIQTDGSTFQLTADDILKLHNDGLSDAVIRAMQAVSVRQPRPAATSQTAVVEPTVVAGTPVVNISQTVSQHVDAPPPAPAYPTYPAYGYPAYGYPAYGFFSFPIAVPVFVPAVAPVVHAAPVYWGWGGQRRPDTWRDDHVANVASVVDPRTMPSQQFRK
jgi:hypothetical protein